MSFYDPSASGYDVSGFSGISSDPNIAAYANDPTLGTGYDPYANMGGGYDPSQSGYDPTSGLYPMDQFAGGAGGFDTSVAGQTPQAAYQPVQTELQAGDLGGQAGQGSQQPGQQGQQGAPGTRSLQQLAQDQQVQRLQNRPVNPQGWQGGGQWGAPGQMPAYIQQMGQGGAGARTGPPGWDPQQGQPWPGQGGQQAGGQQLATFDQRFQPAEQMATGPNQQLPTDQVGMIDTGPAQLQQPGEAGPGTGEVAATTMAGGAGAVPTPQPAPPQQTAQQPLQGGAQPGVTPVQAQPIRPDGRPAGPTGTTDDAKTPQERRQQQQQDRRANPQPRTALERLAANALHQMGLPSQLAPLVARLLGGAGGLGGGGGGGSFPGFGPMGRVRHGRFGYGRGIGGRHGRGMRGFNWYGHRYGDGPPGRGMRYSMGIGDGQQDGQDGQDGQDDQQQDPGAEHEDNGPTPGQPAGGGQPGNQQFAPGALPAGPATPGRGTPFQFGPGNPPVPATAPADTGNQVAGPGVPSGMGDVAAPRTPQEQADLARTQGALQAGAQSAQPQGTQGTQGDLLMSAASPGFASRSVVPFGNNVLSRIQQDRQAMAGAPQITPQFVARSRSAGTSTPPTQGYSGYLRNERSKFRDEISASPRLRAAVAAMLATENSTDPIGPVESLMNRAAMTGRSLQSMLSPSFYGPMRTGAYQRALRQLQANPASMGRYNAAIDMALNGSNVLGGATDQGSGRDPNAGWRGGRVLRSGEVYNDWGGYRGHGYSRMWRERQQRQVQAELAGQQQQATGTQ
jgi:hypothetical protein